MCKLISFLIALTYIATFTFIQQSFSDDKAKGLPPSSQETSRPYPNIFLITIDTLRADHVGIYGYSRNTTPNIDKLAKNSVVFDNFISVLPSTLPSFATYFTGLYPQSHGIFASNPNKASYTYQAFKSFPILAELLLPYRKIAITGNTFLNEQTGFTRGFDKYTIIPHKPLRKTGLHSEKIANQALEEIKLFSLPKPLFLWVHFLDPHVPYNVPKDLHSKFNNDKVSRLKTIQYDRELFNTDRHIGRILQYLENNGYFKNSIIIVTADHGESLGENSYKGHGDIINESSILIPLIVHIPNIINGRRSHLLSNADFLPTLLSLIHIPPPKHIEGKNFAPILLNSQSPEIHDFVFIQNSIKRNSDYEEGLRTKTQKLIKFGPRMKQGSIGISCPDRTKDHHYIFTDLRSEPGLRSFHVPHGIPPPALKHALDTCSSLFDKRIKDLLNRKSTKEEINYSQDQIDELKSLGYL